MRLGGFAHFITPLIFLFNGDCRLILGSGPIEILSPRRKVNSISQSRALLSQVDIRHLMFLLLVTLRGAPDTSPHVESPH